MSQPIHFTPNIPQTLALQDPSGVPQDFTVSYPTADGQVLRLPREAAVKLNELELQPGETFGICRRWSGRANEAMQWDIWLTPETEQGRAKAESAAPGTELERQLSASLQKFAPGRVQEIPAKRRIKAQNEPQELPATGTYGPLPKKALATASRYSGPIPMDRAFAEITRFVTRELKEQGEQWNDQAKQDAICSVFIAAQKAGYLGVWER
jgi:hypothetical protein